MGLEMEMDKLQYQHNDMYYIAKYVMAVMADKDAKFQSSVSSCACERAHRILLGMHITSANLSAKSTALRRKNSGEWYLTALP
jgi:hypothetical protein